MTDEQKPTAWAVWWGIEHMRMNSVHIERATASDVASEIKSRTELRPLYDQAAIDAAVAAERERMIADGWRQTRYAAPVTDCEACLTPDACAIRGQCGHYLREQLPAARNVGPSLSELTTKLAGIPDLSGRVKG